MKTALKILLVVYLIVLLVLSLSPLTGYYAALGSLPVLALYLYRRVVLENTDEAPVLTRPVFLLAGAVFLSGFVLNLFCTLYTTCRMSEFRSGIEEQKKRIYSDSLPGAEPKSPAPANIPERKTESPAKASKK